MLRAKLTVLLRLFYIACVYKTYNLPKATLGGNINPEPVALK